MQIALLTLAAVAAFLWLKNRPKTTPIPPAGDPPMDPPVGMDAIPNNPTTPTTPGRTGTVTPPATGPMMATGIPSSKTSKAASSGLKTTTPEVAPPSDPVLPNLAVPPYRAAVSVLDTILDGQTGPMIAPTPPRPSATITNLLTVPRRSVLDQILDAKEAIIG